MPKRGRLRASDEAIWLRLAESALRGRRKLRPSMTRLKFIPIPVVRRVLYRHAVLNRGRYGACVSDKLTLIHGSRPQAKKCGVPADWLPSGRIAEVWGELIRFRSLTGAQPSVYFFYMWRRGRRIEEISSSLLPSTRLALFLADVFANRNSVTCYYRGEVSPEQSILKAQQYDYCALLVHRAVSDNRSDALLMVVAERPLEMLLVSVPRDQVLETLTQHRFVKVEGG